MGTGNELVAAYFLVLAINASARAVVGGLVHRQKTLHSISQQRELRRK